MDPRTQTGFAILHLHKPQPSSSQTFHETLETAVVNALVRAATNGVHNPPLPHNFPNLRYALLVENQENLRSIERSINLAFGNQRNPRVYLIFREEEKGGDRCVLASGSHDNNLVLCEVKIDPKYIGKPPKAEGKEGAYSKSEKTFDWGDLFQNSVDGEGLRKWFDKAVVQYDMCDTAREPWEPALIDEFAPAEPPWDEKTVED